MQRVRQVRAELVLGGVDQVVPGQPLGHADDSSVGGRLALAAVTGSSPRRLRRAGVPLERREVPLGVERAHTARAGGGDGLPVDVVLDVADGEHARDVRLGRAGLRDQVAVLVVLELVDEELRVRVVADRDEEAAGLDLERLARLGVAQPDAGHRRVAEHLLDDVRGQELDLRRSRGRG